MRTIVYKAIVCMLLFVSAGCLQKQSEPKIFYVSLNGNDYWSGNRADPDKNKTDGPFATLERARDVIRKQKESGKIPENGITIYIRGGVYTIANTFVLTQEDSGTEKAPIHWAAYPGEEVHFIGGKMVSGFELVTDPSVLQRLNPESRGKILQTDLKTQGITEYGEMSAHGSGMELYCKNKRMTLARYPNEGWLKIAKVPQTGEKLVYEGLDRDITAGKLIPRGRHYGRFTYDSDRPERWKSLNDIWMYGYYVWDWSSSFQKIDKIDLEMHEIYPAEPHHGYGYSQGQRFYFLNILEELDAPGEWYLDRTPGILYFWPPEPNTDNDIYVSTMKDLIVHLKGASYITVQGILLEGSQAGTIKIEGGSGNTVAGCILRNCGGTAASIDGGANNGITGCDIYDVGESGIILSGGDRQTLTPAGNYATNNHIHHYGQMVSTYKPAVNIFGVGNVVSHNYVHDAPHLGLWINGNDHVLEYNEIHHICLETGDVGAINIWSDWTFRGNVVRYNYVHHIQRSKERSGWQETMGIYLDEVGSGLEMYGNIFYKVSTGILVNGGRDNTIENNIFIDCEPSVIVTSLGLTWARYLIVKGGKWNMYEKLNAVKYTEPPWSTKYPKLASILDDGDPALATGNMITRNISYGGRWLDLYDGLDFSIVTVKDNLISANVLCSWDKKKWDEKGERKSVTYKYGDREIMDELQKYGNVVTDTNPGFVDVEKENFQFKQDSPAWKLGFKPIPFEKIGLYVDEYRKSLPGK